MIKFCFLFIYFIYKCICFLLIDEKKKILWIFVFFYLFFEGLFINKYRIICDFSGIIVGWLYNYKGLGWGGGF